MAKVLRRAPAGEIHFADGMVRITTAGGTSYCLKPQPAYMQGGPTQPLSVATTCP